MRSTVIALFLVLLTACAPIQQRETMNRTAGVETFSSVGDIMIYVDVKEDLPNIYGGADIWGRKRDRGFSEILFMGLAPDGTAIFRRRDVDILTNETTMTRMGMGTAVVTAQPAGQGLIAAGITTRAPQASINVLPPDTTEFALDLSKGHIITVRDKTIEILSADPSGIRYIVH